MMTDRFDTRMLLSTKHASPEVDLEPWRLFEKYDLNKKLCSMKNKRMEEE